jgi:diacylglycerol O-acyltransferase / wax synthase
MPRFVAPMDAVWLWIESPSGPKHVVVLQVFDRPADAGPDYLDTLYASITDPAAAVKPGFRRRAHRSARTGGQFTWVTEDRLDLAHHVRRHTLPAPGTQQQLLDYVAELHTGVLDRARPQWAARLVDGLEGGGFALCTLLHHSQFDGVNMNRHAIGGLSTDPAATDCAAPWLQPHGRPAPAAEPAGRSEGLADWVRDPAKAAGAGRRALSTAAGVARSLGSLARSSRTSLRTRELPFAAPGSLFNSKITERRQFVGETWALSRYKDIAKRTGTSINDVCVTVTGGALRAYLVEQDALPERSLVGGIPVATTGTDASAAGRDDNTFGAVLCNLGTDLTDPVERLRRVHASMANSKALMAELDPVTASAFTTFNIGGFLAAAVPSVPELPRPTFNAVVSNVPGPRTPLYWNGARMTMYHPSSVVMHGQALNITLLSYVDTITVGMTVCPDVVRNADRLPVHMENALAELEKATADLGA